jgi:hypothetical protein
LPQEATLQCSESLNGTLTSSPRASKATGELNSVRSHALKQQLKNTLWICHSPTLKPGLIWNCARRLCLVRYVSRYLRLRLYLVLCLSRYVCLKLCLVRCVSRYLRLRLCLVLCLSRYVRLKAMLGKLCVSLSPPKAMLGKVCLVISA